MSREPYPIGIEGYGDMSPDTEREIDYKAAGMDGQPGTER